MRYSYKTQMTCSSQIDFDINDGIITNISFIGGCNGNLKAISKLVDGWSAQQISDKLEGNLCGRRHTSCADQLAKAVCQAYEKEKAQS